MTQNYSIHPTFYRVVFNSTSPTNYSALTSTQAGGMDIGKAVDYNRRVSVTGNIAITTNVMASGETIVINGYNVAFASSDYVTDILTKIQTASTYTNVTATNAVNPNCVTITNTVDQMGYPFYLQEGNGSALSKLGIAAGTYKAGVTEIGSTFTNFIAGDVITINGVVVLFSTTTTVAGAVSAINAVSNATGVIAQLAAGAVQLSSVNNQAYQLGGSNISSLGFTVGNHGGWPNTLTGSEVKEQANMRYLLAVEEIEKMATPFFTGNWATTGDQTGNAVPTTFSFTVAFNQVDYVTTTATASEPDNGTVYTSALAVRRSVARALVDTMNSNRKVYDPTLQTIGYYTNRPNPSQILNLTATGVDVVGNIQIIENNLTVTQITYV